MKPLALALLYVVPGIALPGFSQGSRVSPQNDRLRPVDCFVVHAGPSCQSFNEMLQGGTFSTILTQPASTTFVCFRQQDDGFVVVHFDRPLQWDTPYEQPDQRPQRNGKEVDMVKSDGSLSLVEYKQKMRGRSFNVNLNWWKAAPDSDRDASASASGNLHTAPTASVTSREVSLSLAHMSNGTAVVDYSLDIHRLTRRFSEELPVAKTSISASAEKNRIQENGYCAEFNQPAPH